MSDVSAYNVRKRELATQPLSLHDDLRLYKEVCRSVWFGECCMILFMNKLDLLAAKLKIDPLQVCFPEYKGANGAGTAAAADNAMVCICA